VVRESIEVKKYKKLCKEKSPRDVLMRMKERLLFFDE
jgi:hypothetical protein